MKWLMLKKQTKNHDLRLLLLKERKSFEFSPWKRMSAVKILMEPISSIVRFASQLCQRAN